MFGRSMEERLAEDVDQLGQELMPGAVKNYSTLAQGQVRAHLVKFYRRMDDLVSHAAGEIDCKAGCAMCCHYHVMVTATEAFTIAEQINAMSSDRRDEIKRRISGTAARVATMSSAEYMRTNVACALLESGLCSVYEVRPIACRSHHSTDVGVCKRTFDDPDSTEFGPLDYQRKLASTAMDNVNLMALHHLGLDSSKYELHASLFTALTNPSALKRWRKGKTAFPTVADKVTLQQMIARQ
jgi:Fe-S-cluster containining protein